MIREIDTRVITEKVAELCIAANKVLPSDIEKSIEKASALEDNTLARSILSDIRENTKKMEEKRAKQGLPPQKITTQAHQSARNINSVKPDSGSAKGSGSSADKNKKIDAAYEKARTAKPGSITAKANMVRDYNERNKK